MVLKWGKPIADGFTNLQKKQIRFLQSCAWWRLQPYSSTVVKCELRNCHREQLGYGGVRWLGGRLEEVRAWLGYIILVDGWLSGLCCRPRPLHEHIWKSLWRGSGNCKQPPTFQAVWSPPLLQPLPPVCFFLSLSPPSFPSYAVNLSASYHGRL